MNANPAPVSTVKALFFLRHYNDIDHITPVIDQWVRKGHECDVVLIGEGHFRDDYRIAYLASLERVRLAHLDEILARGDLARMRVQKIMLNRYFRAAVPGLVTRALERVLDPDERTGFWQQVADTLLQRTFAEGEAGVVCFDWISSNSVLPFEFVEQAVSLARERGLGSVSLPHGDSPHANFLVREDELKIEPRQKFAAARIFDRVVVPNELCASRYRPFLEPEKIAVLGSPRYCDEWMERLAGLLPANPLTPDPDRFKLVLFLRKRDFSIFWDEVQRVIRMLAAFPGLELIVKAHTRGGWRQPLSRNPALRHLGNVRFVGSKIHSSHLLEWADAVMDIATSVSFESVKKRQPVLAADYLHAGLSTVGAYCPECMLDCRDDAYTKVERLINDGCDGFYVEAHRQKFLDEITDVPDADVLPRFVGLLETLVAAEV